MSKFGVTFKTLTPLWTGDAERKNTKLRETGIIGSLRWWYEALVRGMGYKACDSTDDKCQVEIKNPDDVSNIHEKICPVCYLFGTTGWKGRFAVEVENNELESINKFEIRTRTSRNGRRYLSRYCDGLFGSFTLIFSFSSNVPYEYICLFVKLLKLLSDYGMIGAKISQGNGVCDIKFQNDTEYFNVNECLDKKFIDIKLEESENQKNCESCPKLSDFKFLKVDIQMNNGVNFNHIWRKNNDDSKSLNHFEGNINESWDKGILPISFHVRDLIRSLWRADRNLRHNIMGEMGKGANIFVSHGYKTGSNQIELRVIGYGLEDSQWEDIKNNLNNTQLNRFLWFNNRSYISSINIEGEISGQNLLKRSDNNEI